MSRKASKPAETEAAAAPGQSGRYAYEGLDRTIHEKARLGILTSLAAHAGGLLFNDLKTVCSLSDGNLSRHLQTLEEAGLVEVRKRVERRRPQSLYRLTDLGRKRLLSYVAELERVVADAARVRQPAPRKSAANPLPGWATG